MPWLLDGYGYIAIIVQHDKCWQSDIFYMHQYTCIIADILANYRKAPLQRIHFSSSTGNSQSLHAKAASATSFN